MKCDFHLIPQTQNHSKQIKDWNINPKIKIIIRKHRGKTLWHGSWQWFLGYSTQRTGNKSKSRQVGLHKTKGLLHNKGNHQQSKRPYTEWKNTFEPHIWSEVNTQNMQVIPTPACKKRKISIKNSLRKKRKVRASLRTIFFQEILFSQWKIKFSIRK